MRILVCVVIIFFIGFLSLDDIRSEPLELQLKLISSFKDKGISQLIDFSSDVFACQYKKGYLLFSGNGKLLYIDKSDFSVLSSLQLNKGKGPGEYIGISKIMTIDDYIYLYDCRLMRLLQFSEKSNELSYIDTFNLNFQGALEACFEGGFFYFNSLVGTKKGYFPAVEVFDQNLNKINTILLEDLEIKTRQDIANHLGWFIQSPEYLYYISLGNGRILKIDKKEHKIVQVGYQKRKLINVNDNAKRKKVSVIAVAENRGKICSLYSSDEDGGFYYEIFAKDSLQCLGAGTLKIPQKKYLIINNTVLRFSHNKCILYRLTY